MSNRIARAYCSLIDRYMKNGGYAPEERCLEVFGGIPAWENVGPVGEGCIFPFNKTHYVR
jgi:hypothetical protein